MESQPYAAAKYTVAIEVATPPNEVFNLIVNDPAKFWPEEIEGESTRLNDEFVFRSGDGHFSKNKVVELVPGERVVWLVTESLRKTDNFDWTGSKMIFELTPKGGHTLLEFTYDGVTLENEYDRLVQICDMVIKENLYNLITNGNRGFSTTIEVAGSPRDVFGRILEVSKWWSKDFEGHSATLNDEFVICHPGRHYSKHRLIELVPGKKVVWLVTESKLDWLEKDPSEWTGTKMVFELSARGDNTVIYFTHEGLVPEKACYDRCREGWNMVISERLFDYITTGKTV